MPPGRIPLFQWLNLVFYALLAFEMLRLWIAPGPGDAARIYTLTILMAFEFVMVHSGVFMAVMPRRWSMLIFVPFYGLFALAFTASAGNLSILFIYLAVVAVRARHAFSDASDEVRARTVATSVAAAGIYFACVFVFAMGAGLVPAFGLTGDYLDASGYRDLMTAEGIFPEMPQVPLAMGAVYYLLLAYAEFRISRMDALGTGPLAEITKAMPERIRARPPRD